jgi:hypothetical protein
MKMDETCWNLKPGDCSILKKPWQIMKILRFPARSPALAQWVAEPEAGPAVFVVWGLRAFGCSPGPRPNQRTCGWPKGPPWGPRGPTPAEVRQGSWCPSFPRGGPQEIPNSNGFIFSIKLAINWRYTPCLQAHPYHIKLSSYDFSWYQYFIEVLYMIYIIYIIYIILSYIS